MEFSKVVDFHGHVCPGLAMGYRVAELAVRELVFERAGDEELVAIVENNSCAVDAIQAVCGCTFGKGNLIFRDFGKQVYTFARRPQGEGIRIKVQWTPPTETQERQAFWKRYMAGDHSSEVVKDVKEAKAAKVEAILAADDQDLFAIEKLTVELPGKAKIYPTLTCVKCGEKVMEPKTVVHQDGPICQTCHS